MEWWHVSCPRRGSGKSDEGDKAAAYGGIAAEGVRKERNTLSNILKSVESVEKWDQHD
jgi:hypothetical protein